LAFTPTDGLVYTLDARVTGMGLVGGADNDWFALGFVNTGPLSGDGGTSDRFITGNTIGNVWMMHRGDTTLGTNQAFLGDPTFVGTNPGLEGEGVTYAPASAGTGVDMRLILDTTGGSGAWAASWWAKRPGDGSYTLFRTESALLDEASINAVGIARSNPGVTGTFESFSLSSEVPEPSSLLLLALGGLSLLRRRRD
jgi:hypothetical protein